MTVSVGMDVSDISVTADVNEFNDHNFSYAERTSNSAGNTVGLGNSESMSGSEDSNQYTNGSIEFPISFLISRRLQIWLSGKAGAKKEKWNQKPRW